MEEKVGRVNRYADLFACVCGGRGNSLQMEALS